MPTPVVGLGGASDIEANDDQSYAIVSPSRALSVAFAGAGSGKVGTEGILCPPSCSNGYADGQVQVLRAEPNPGSGFAGFTGACTGTGPCQVKMAQDQTVTATFGPPAGSAITGFTKRKRRAAFSFAAPGAVTGFECKLKRPKPKPKKGKKAKRPRAVPKFAPCGPGKAYKRLKPGRYRFEVRAVNILGADAKPAVRKFGIKAPKKKPGKRP